MSNQPSEKTPEDIEEPPISVERPVKQALTPQQKCVSWLTKGVIEDVESMVSSSFTSRHYWTDRQTEVVDKATQHLHHRAGVEIYQAVQKDLKCQRHKITDVFSQQQIRDKFKNLSKKR